MRIIFFLFGWIIISALYSQVPVIDDVYRQEIKSLASHPSIQRAFEMIEALEPETEALLIDITQIEAPPFMEEIRAQFVFDRIKSLGLDSLWIDEVGNVLALKKGKMGHRTIAFDAHLDTVFPKGTDVKVRRSGDTLMAPGIGDDTRGLAMLLTTIKAIQSTSIQTEEDILFVASVGEEGLGDLRGVKHLFSEMGYPIDSWISIDGGEIGRVNTKGLGSYRYRVRFEGPGGHSWGAFGLANPHHALGKAIDLFVQRADVYTLEGPKTSYNIGVISGGTSVNSIPFESIMEVDMRSIDPSRLEVLEKMLYQAVEDAVADQNNKKRLGAPLTGSIDKIGHRPSGELADTLPLVQRALAATALMGKVPRITVGSTNSNIPISLGIPAVTIGRGGAAANAHALDEWWLNTDGGASIQLGLILLIAEAGLVP